MRRIAAILTLSLLLAGCSGSKSDGRPKRPDAGQSVVVQNVVEPTRSGQDGYAGSESCRLCHASLFEGWISTVHARSVRSTSLRGLTGKAVVADADGNGVDDFRQGLDLATVPAFGPFGANAPRLSYVARDERPYKITIGGIRFDVWYTIGGNGYGGQVYVLRVGNTHFVAPVQYLEQAPVGASHRYATYSPESWYDPDTGLPLLTNPATAALDIDTNTSFERRCAGCHSTGLLVGLDPSNRFVLGATELSIGCEDCHGPGAAHIDSGGDSTYIIQPRDLLNGTAAGVLAADGVCGRCHSRGASHEALSGAVEPFGFPWSPARGVMGAEDLAQGAQLEDFFAPSSDPSDFWDRKDNPMGFVPTPGNPADDTFVASRIHTQQFTEQQSGPHASDRAYDAVCFDCHAAHGSRREHLVAETLDRAGETFAVDADDNSLCLACHHGHGPFATLTASDVASIATGSPTAAVAQVVVDHLRDVAMPVSTAAYDPVRSGVGRCIECHMVQTARSAVTTIDRAGFLTGDVHSHVFLPVVPFASVRTQAVQGEAVGNSCSVCHPLFAGDPTARKIQQYLSDPDGDGTFHPDLPRNFQNGVANPGNAAGGVACVACHTTEGFLQIQVEENDIHHLNGPGDAAARTAIVKSAIGQDHGILCHACHGKDINGQFQPDNLRFSKAELCGRCHNDETVKFADFRATGAIVRHPQREMLAGTAGVEVSGTYGNSPHSFGVLFPDGCVECHYDLKAAGFVPSHDFEPDPATCGRCHAGLMTFNRPATGDYDGSGRVEGIQEEVEGLLEEVADALVDGVTIWRDGEYFVDTDPSSPGYSQGTANKLLKPSVSDAQRRAVFNWYSVEFDGSFGVHNAVRIVQLLQRSYREVTGVDVPGAVLR